MSAYAENWSIKQRQQYVGTQKIHNDGVAQKEGKAHKHPGKEGGLEIQQTEEIHPNIGVSPAPNIHQHDCEGLTQEHKADKNPKYLKSH